MKILVVEDDELLRQGLLKALQQEQYSCDAVASLAEAEAHVGVTQYGLVLLDLGLPDGDGLTLLRRWRRQGQAMPVLILTARDTLDEKIQGLDLGADDYMVKPFALAELQARVRALLRRDHGQASNRLECGDLCLDLDDKLVTLDGAPVVLTRREFALLRRLAMAAGKTVNRERLQEDLYDWQDDIGSNTLEVHIHHLRRKLGAERISTVRGEGYRLEKEITS
ncbi:response regulator [Pseudaeromonas sp. ZJS20]|uniref:response regulator n=1 Tax=Pseudaeromonas aegiceratis TaxID=3153928 RepID=UPI00390CC0FD